MNIDDLRKLNGWYRAGIAASLLWILVATIAYWTSLGRHYIPEGGLVELLPAVVIAWWRFSNNFGVFLFEITDSSDHNYTTLGFDFIGFGAYVLIPIAVLWGLGFMGAWVVAGFKKTN